MQVTVTNTFEIPNVKYTPRQLMEFLDFKAGTKESLQHTNPFYRYSKKKAIKTFYEWEDVRERLIIGESILFKIIHDKLGIHELNIKSDIRRREVTAARDLFCYFMYHHSGRTLVEIGDMIGGKHHSTVINAKQKIADLLSAGDVLTIKKFKLISDEINKINGHVPETEIHQEGGEDGAQPDSQAVQIVTAGI